MIVVAIAPADGLALTYVIRNRIGAVVATEAHARCLFRYVWGFAG